MSISKKEVFIIGGGISGLGVAHYLKKNHQDKVNVTVLEQETVDSTLTSSFNECGLLRPHPDLLPKGVIADLCKECHKAFPGWLKEVEALAISAGGDPDSEGHKFLVGNQAYGKVPGEVPTFSADGYLFPDFEDTEVKANGKLGEDGIRAKEPLLCEGIKGGLWCEGAVSIHTSSLTRSLRAACAQLNATMKFGPDFEVISVESKNGKPKIRCKGGATFAPDAVVTATGIWSRENLDSSRDMEKRKVSQLLLDAKGKKKLNNVVFTPKVIVIPSLDETIMVESDTCSKSGVAKTEEQLRSEAANLLPDLDIPNLDRVGKLNNVVFAPKYIVKETGLEMEIPRLRVTNMVSSDPGVYLAGAQQLGFGILGVPKIGQLVGQLIMGGGDKKVLSAKDKDLFNHCGQKVLSRPALGKKKNTQEQVQSGSSKIFVKSHGENSGNQRKLDKHEVGKKMFGSKVNDISVPTFVGVDGLRVISQCCL